MILQVKRKFLQWMEDKALGSLETLTTTITSTNSLSHYQTTTSHLTINSLHQKHNTMSNLYASSHSCKESRFLRILLYSLVLFQYTCLASNNQTTDLKLSEIDKLNSNNITRLRDYSSNTTELQTHQSEDTEIDASLSKIIKSKRHKKKGIFSSWSSWSKCDIYCRQRRARTCINRKKCGSIKQQEEQTCAQDICEPSFFQIDGLFESESEDNNESEEETIPRVRKYKKHKKHKKEQQHEIEPEDPYEADEEGDDDDVPQKKSIQEQDRLVLKVVKQRDYETKQLPKRSSKSRFFENEIFLPRNLTMLMNSNATELKTTSNKRKRFSDDYMIDDTFEYDDEVDKSFLKSGLEKGKIKAVFEMPRKPLPNYSKWSRWTKCSPKCTTRRFKKCKPHARQVCGNDIIREIAYCYTEGSFCEEWISSQINQIGAANTIEPPKLTTKTPKVDRRTESPLINSVSHDFYNLNKPTRGKKKIAPEFRPQNIQCGFPSIRNKKNDFALKIIGGKSSRRGQWPWQVAILNRFKEAFCGGTLISPNFVLTAAHCVRKRLFVKLAEHNLQAVDGNEMEFRIEIAIKHPKYDKKTVDNDIALLKLPQSMERSHYIGFACLPERLQQLPVGHTCTIIGWGKRRHNDDSGTNVLHEAEVPIISNEECKSVYYDYTITKNMFCAGHKKGRIDTCAGDSGGPILCRDSKKSNKPWTVYGITSFGDGCGKKNKFGIYTKLTNYVDFIWSIVNCNGICKS